MQKTLVALVKNFLRAKLGTSTWFDPVIATIYATPMCNLRCGYCDDFGAQRNDQFRGQLLAPEKMKRVLDILAKEANVLYVTGGEPTMNPDLCELLEHARRVGFKYMSMNTNALLLRDHEHVMDLVDNLVVSIDSMESGRWDDTLARQPDQVSKLFDNVRWLASEQEKRGFTLIITCVITPGRVASSRKVMEFAFDIGAHFSPQHLSVERLPSVELANDPEFRAFVGELIEYKHAGRKVSGSDLYLSAIRDGERKEYACMPTAAPHVDWMGRLAYPCRELPDHIWIDLLAAGSYKAAMREAERRYGAPPEACNRCGERCYVEMSTLMRDPRAAAREVAGYIGQSRLLRGLVGRRAAPVA